MQTAKSKLDAALNRLEKAIDTTPILASGSDELAKELVAAKAEISQLREKNQTVSAKLDGAIGRVKEILES
jgi:hypothetical protein